MLGRRLNRKNPTEITKEGVERLETLGTTVEGGSVLNTGFRAYAAFYVYKA